MTDIDYSKQKGVADETHWIQFVQEVGGQLVAPLITRQNVKNADFLFKSRMVVAELKIFETEFAHTPEIMLKVEPLLAAYRASESQLEKIKIDRELESLIKKPLRRIINKANRQIKETKIELGLYGYSGVIICVNDNFRNVPPDIIIYMLQDIINESAYKNTNAIIYLTNHFVEFPNNPYASLFWTAVYKREPTDEIVDFVDDLGRKWHDFTEKKIGLFDYRRESPDRDIDGASVVSGPLRNNRYSGP